MTALLLMSVASSVVWALAVLVMTVPPSRSASSRASKVMTVSVVVRTLTPSARVGSVGSFSGVPLISSEPPTKVSPLGSVSEIRAGRIYQLGGSKKQVLVVEAPIHSGQGETLFPQFPNGIQYVIGGLHSHTFHLSCPTFLPPFAL